jgi:hypothetical protein
MDRITFDARVVKETTKAILLSVRMMEVDPIGSGFIEFEREAWIPLSQLTRVASTGDTRETQCWSIPRWLATQKGLVVKGGPGKWARHQEAY